ncbi:MAG: hypothetical protein GY772_33010 [bacterium]|nr:hypothetical protein [bacterium]
MLRTRTAPPAAPAGRQCSDRPLCRFTIRSLCSLELARPTAAPCTRSAPVSGRMEGEDEELGGAAERDRTSAAAGAAPYYAPIRRGGPPPLPGPHWPELDGIRAEIATLRVDVLELRREWRYWLPFLNYLWRTLRDVGRWFSGPPGP